MIFLIRTNIVNMHRFYFLAAVSLLLNGDSALKELGIWKSLFKRLSWNFLKNTVWIKLFDSLICEIAGYLGEKIPYIPLNTHSILWTIWSILNIGIIYPITKHRIELSEFLMFCNNPHKSLQCSRLSRHQIVLQNWLSTEKSEVTYYSVLDFS